jgi:hypothetical protein
MTGTVQHGPAFEYIGQRREAARHCKAIGTRTIHIYGVASQRGWWLGTAVPAAPCETR